MRFLNAKDRFKLISSTAPVEDYPVWSADTTYNEGDIVIYNNRIYKSLVDNNTEEPGAGLNWADEGATNPYKCLDEFVNTQTEAPEDFEMFFEITKSDAVALMNLQAAKVELEIYDKNGKLVAQKEASTITGINDWEDYFFGDLEYVNKLFIPFPYVFYGTLKVKVIGVNVKVGVVQVGKLQEIGVTLIGASASIDDYSKKEADENGNVYLQEGNFADRTECKVVLDNVEFNKVKKKLADVRAQAVVWLASEDDIFRELNLYGFYESFDIEIENSVKSECKLTLRGLV